MDMEIICFFHISFDISSLFSLYLIYQILCAFRVERRNQRSKHVRRHHYYQQFDRQTSLDTSVTCM